MLCLDRIGRCGWLTAAMLLLACSSSSEGSGARAVPALAPGGSNPASGSLEPPASGSVGAPTTPSMSSFGSPGSAGSSARPPEPGSSEASGDAISGGSTSGEPDAGIEPEIALEPGQLTAGEWSDLEEWTFWRNLHRGSGDCEDQTTSECSDDGLGAFMSSHWGYDTAGRVAVRVVHGDEPVVDAEVELWGAQDQQPLWSARTNNEGQAELFTGLYAPSAGPYRVRVAAAGESVEVQAIEPTSADAIEIEFPIGYTPAPSLDLMFVVDTTGSMGDELDYIQAELASVIERVRQQIGVQLAVRLSVNFYRDHGDEYVVRAFPFTADIDEALLQLGDQRADGGGDTPEALEEALQNAVDGHVWSDAATARLLFFVLDAPPHYDAARVEQLHASTRAAAAAGVQIVPLAASGVDKSTEFLLRMLAISTHGTYTFLTDDSGIGNPHLAPTIGDYEVELLDDLLVRVIEEAL